MTSRSNTKPPPAQSVDLAGRVGKAGERYVPPILLPDGTLAPGAECPLGDEAVIEALVLMIRSRLVDERGVSFQRQGRILPRGNRHRVRHRRGNFWNRY